MSAAAIRSALSCGRSACDCSKGGVKAHCPGPSHQNGDRNPSLGVTEKDGKILVRCYGGCAQPDVIAVLQERGLWPRQEASSPKGSSPGKRTRVVAHYDYRDATGGIAFQVVRRETWVEADIVDGEHVAGHWRKGFFQRRPNTSGGWDYKKGDTSILYRLPELLAADPGEIVWLCEGEKDADRLTSLGLVATTRAEGAGKWKGPESKWLEGRRVVVLQDNDEPGTLDARLKLADLAKTARAAILTLEPLPEHGDVSDWLDMGGSLEYLIALGEAVLESAPEPPAVAVEAAESTPEPPAPMVSFPTEVLPPSMARLVRSSAVALSVPPEFVGVPLLVLAGAAIGNAWEIEVKKGWREGPNLYAAVVADPGSGKTPALRIAIRPIDAIQNRLTDAYRAAKKRHDVELAEWESAIKATRGAKPEPPVYEHVWTTDPTTEALASMLANTKGLAFTRDELVGWVMSMDAYRSGKGADRQHYLSMWGRASIKIDRRSQPDPIIVRTPCLSVVGGIQPDKLPMLVEKGDTDDGFLDRLLWAYPDLGSSRWTDAGVDEQAETDVDRLFMALHELKGWERVPGTTIPNVARFDGGAHAIWREWFDEREAEERSDDLPASLKGTWAKLPGQLARVALILHVAWAVDAGAEVSRLIPQATIAAAADLMDYFKDHARAALASVRTSRTILESRVIRILSERTRCTTTQLYEALNRKVKADRLNGALERLVEDGKVARVSVPAGPKGGRPASMWEIVEEVDVPAKHGHEGGFFAREHG